MLVETDDAAAFPDSSPSLEQPSMTQQLDVPSVYPPPEISISDITVSEGDSGIIQAIFSILRSGYLGSISAIGFTTADGSAVQPGDYASQSGTLVFEPNVASLTVTVDVNGDTLSEADENFFLDLGDPLFAEIIDAQAQCTITNDDPQPGITIDDATLTEGDSGTAGLSFTVHLDAASGQTVSVDFSTANGSAVQPGDYLSASGTVTFIPGETAETIQVNIVGDILDEADETFLVDLANPLNATLTDNQALGTINDDDPSAEITIADATVMEGDSGTASASFTVALNTPSGKTVSVEYSTADDTATQPDDYLPASGTLTFIPGDVSESMTINVAGDILTEGDEAFLVNLANPTNGTIADNQAVGTISDDDQLPEITISDATATEGDSGTTSVSFLVALSASSSKTVSVTYATGDNTASQPADYQLTTGTLTFVPGDTAEQVRVNIVGDAMDEDDETFLVDLSGPVNATLADDQALGTIIDDDPPPGIRIADLTVAEGSSGTTTASFTVTLNSASGKTVTVDYAAADDTATQPADYLSASGTLTFLPGDISENINVDIVGDIMDENDETFVVNLSNPSNGRIADNQALATISDDDLPPGISIADTAITEGNSGTTAATFVVSLSTASSKTVRVNYASANGSAIQPADYQPGSALVTFNPGEVSRNIQINIVGDTLDEIDETFLVNLSNPLNGSLQDSQGTGTITDDDLPPNMSIEDVTVIDAITSNVLATFVIRLDAPSGKQITVNFATQDNSAIAPQDYLATTGQATINPGQTQFSITVTVIGSSGNEPAESFFVNLSGAVNANLVDNQAIGTIFKNYLVFLPIVLNSNDAHWYHPP